MFHLFHIVSFSPWPLFGSLGGLFLVSFLLFVMNLLSVKQMLVFLLILGIALGWWSDVVRESLLDGGHLLSVLSGLKLGMILFIISEVFFFFSFFWTFFHSSVSPTFELGQSWPPQGVCGFNPLNVPLLNTLILLSSGATVTWSHNKIFFFDYFSSFSLSFTIFLGIYFSFLQYMEYLEGSFSFSDSVYGSIFFMATGFHGLHVLIGSLFLFVAFVRLSSNHSSSSHHFCFEAAAWYWHFVDVVWLFLYCVVYWWGN